MVFAARIALFFSGLFLAALPALAADNCTVLYSTAVAHPKIKFTTKVGTPFNQKQKEHIETLFSGLAIMLNHELEAPTELVVEMGPKSDWSDHIKGVIHAPAAFQSTAYAKHPAVTDIVLDHEWGHALFAKNIRARFPDIKSALAEPSRELGDAREVLIPYDELFADTTAVVRTKNGRSPRLPIFSSGLKQKKNENARLRDFTISHRLQGWKYEGAYALLSPTRSFLWSRYLSKPMVQKQPGKVLSALLDAIGNEATLRLRNLSLKPTPEEINSSLIAEIERQMAKQGFY